MSKPFVLPLALAWLILLVAGGCDGPQAPMQTSSRGPATNTADNTTAGNQGDAVVVVGDVSIHASVVQTSVLPESVARQYGIDRDPKTVLLLVAVRKGPPASAVSLSARVTATATDLRGGRQEIVMREVRTGALADSIGTTPTTLPDTLRFDLTVAVEGMAPAKMQFEREFYPQ